MEIGILTFHRAHNYGAILQCFALQTFLCNQGHSVRVIDYNNKMLWRYYSWYKPEEMHYAFSNPRKILQRCIKLIIKWHKRIPRFNAFSRFQSNRLNLCPVSDIIQNPFDLILIGSDQVWNTAITHGLDPYYWGQIEHPASTRIATYAASLKGIWEEKDRPVIQQYLQSLDAISVREKSVAIALPDIFPEINPIIVPDPVLLLSAKEWSKYAICPKIKEPYVFFYQAMDSEDAYSISDKIARHSRKRFISLSANVNSKNSICCRSASPFEFVGWIESADLVITSSFHAAALCIVFQKEFYCIDLNIEGDSRLKDLLKSFGFEDHLICSFDDFIRITSSTANEVPNCDNLLESGRLTAIEYINSVYKHQ